MLVVLASAAVDMRLIRDFPGLCAKFTSWWLNRPASDEREGSIDACSACIWPAALRSAWLLSKEARETRSSCSSPKQRRRREAAARGGSACDAAHGLPHAAGEAAQRGRPRGRALRRGPKQMQARGDDARRRCVRCGPGAFHTPFGRGCRAHLLEGATCGPKQSWHARRRILSQEIANEDVTFVMRPKKLAA